MRPEPWQIGLVPLPPPSWHQRPKQEAAYDPGNSACQKAKSASAWMVAMRHKGLLSVGHLAVLPRNCCSDALRQGFRSSLKDESNLGGSD